MPLYKFEWNCGRMGQLEAVFEATPEDVEALVGSNVYFGEVLGKHSEISGKVREGEVTLLSEDEEFIAKANECGLVPIGYNLWSTW